MTEFFKAIEAERRQQIIKWGENERSLPELVTILTEEVGEVAKEAHDIHFESEFDFLEGSKEKLRTEIIQAATVLYRMWIDAGA